MSHQYEKILRGTRRVSNYEVMNDGQWIAKQIMKSKEEYEDEEEKTQFQRMISKAWIRALTDTQRRYLYLYYVQGMKQAEIAEECGVAPCTISRTIRRGRARLMDILRYR